MADRYGVDLRRSLRSAERLSERAMAPGVGLAKTLRSRSSASLLRVTAADHFRRDLVFAVLDFALAIACAYLLPPRPFWSRGLRSGLFVSVFFGGLGCCKPPGFFFAFSSASLGLIGLLM